MKLSKGSRIIEKAACWERQQLSTETLHGIRKRVEEAERFMKRFMILCRYVMVENFQTS
jgi:hypothetical protein